jgi:hypothetical protein
MVAVCNVCPGASKAIVWFKFSDGIWRSFKPNTFPFAYQTINKENGNWGLTFYTAPSDPPRRWGVEIRAQNAYGSNAFSGNFFNSSLLDAGRWWGDASAPNIRFELRSGGADGTTCGGVCVCDNYWVAIAKDRCGNDIEIALKTNTYSLLLQYNSVNCRTTNGYQHSYKAIVSGSPYIASAVLQPYNPSLDVCGNCPNGWNKALGEITGQGEPQIQVSCNANKCPPDTICECDCGSNEICCWSADGNVVYSYLK